MKKSIIFAAIAAVFASSTMTYAETVNTTVPTETQTKIEMKHQKQRQYVDDRLKLTEEQKEKVKELRVAGHQKIKPIFEKIKAKHEEIKAIANNSSLSQSEKNRKIKRIEKELLKLKQQAREIKKENMEQFKALLTEEQKAELEKIKQEARAKRMNSKNSHKNHTHNIKY